MIDNHNMHELVELVAVGKENIGGLEVKSREGKDDLDVLVGGWVTFLELSLGECIF